MRSQELDTSCQKMSIEVMAIGRLDNVNFGEKKTKYAFSRIHIHTKNEKFQRKDIFLVKAFGDVADQLKNMAGMLVHICGRLQNDPNRGKKDSNGRMIYDVGIYVDSVNTVEEDIPNSKDIEPSGEMEDDLQF